MARAEIPNLGEPVDGALDVRRALHQRLAAVELLEACPAARATHMGGGGARAAVGGARRRTGRRSAAADGETAQCFSPAAHKATLCERHLAPLVTDRHTKPNQTKNKREAPRTHLGKLREQGLVDRRQYHLLATLRLSRLCRDGGRTSG